jgi:hypothetical protein
MIELWFSHEDKFIYSLLSDGCHEVCYSTGARFKWNQPEKDDLVCAKFSFKDANQEQLVLDLLIILTMSVPANHEINYCLLHSIEG